MEFYQYQPLENVLRKTVSPCRWRGLEDDLVCGNNASSLACRCDEGDNEETIADADLWLLCLGHHRQQGQIKDSLFVWNVVQGGASVLFLFSYQFQTTQILR